MKNITNEEPKISQKWSSYKEHKGNALAPRAEEGREEVSRWQTPCRVGRKVFFKADVADKSQYTYGDELWVTDGTEAGTFRVSEINLEPKFGEDGKTQIGTLGPCVLYMQNYYNKGVTFRAWSMECGNEGFQHFLDVQHMAVRQDQR